MIIDTNFYSRLVADPKSVLELLAGDKHVALPLPVVAELRSGFAGGSKQITNEANLTEFIESNTTTVLLPSEATTYIYAELQQYARYKGKALSNNDIWIAALAREDGDTLVTFDRDFDVFQGLFGNKLNILS